MAGTPKKTGGNPVPLNAAGTASVEPASDGLRDRVWFSCGLTLNLGNYESARVDAGMATDVLPGESREAALDRCKSLVTREIQNQAHDVRINLAGAQAQQQPAQPNKRKY